MTQIPLSPELACVALSPLCQQITVAWCPPTLVQLIVGAENLDGGLLQQSKALASVRLYILMISKVFLAPLTLITNVGFNVALELYTINRIMDKPNETVSPKGHAKGYI